MLAASAAVLPAGSNSWLLCELEQQAVEGLKQPRDRRVQL
jgi:hypothetical protein